MVRQKKKEKHNLSSLGATSQHFLGILGLKLEIEFKRRNYYNYVQISKNPYFVNHNQRRTKTINHEIQLSK